MANHARAGSARVCGGSGIVLSGFGGMRVRVGINFEGRGRSRALVVETSDNGRLQVWFPEHKQRQYVIGVDEQAEVRRATMRARR